MPLFTENFDAVAVGSLPASWTAASGWSVAASSPNVSAPNVLQVSSASAPDSYYTGATWTASSVLVAAKTTVTPAAQYGPMISARSAGGLAGYLFTLNWSQDGTAVLQLRRMMVNPGVLAAAQAVYADNTLPVQGTWIWMRLAYDPSAGVLRGRIWPNGGAEPTTWQLSAAENLLTGAGWAGLWSEQASGVAFDSFEVDTFTGGGTIPAPSITSFSPISGPIGTLVTITGINFGANPGDNLVTFNGVAAAVSSATSATLIVTVPAGASTGPVAVQTSGGTAVGSTFTVTPPVVTGSTPTIAGFSPTSGPVGTIVTITGTGFDLFTPGVSIQGNQVAFNGAAALIQSATSTQIVAVVPPAATTGPISETTLAGSTSSATSFTVTGASPVTGTTIPPDNYDGTPDEGPLTPSDLLPFLRALLKDSAADIAELGLTTPTWSDPELRRYLELARGEYTRHRGKRAHVLMATAANQQEYTVSGALVIEDVMWAPAGYDLDQISALAAALAGGPGLLWGGGVPVVGRVYFDSPASIQIWSIIREAWRNTFGGHWERGDTPDGFRLLPVPTSSGLNVFVKYRAECLWADIPWQHRMFILAQAVLFAIEGMTYQQVAGSTAQGVKLSLGMRALVMLIQQKYADVLNIREPGVTAGRS